MYIKYNLEPMKYWLESACRRTFFSLQSGGLCKMS